MSNLISSFLIEPVVRHARRFSHLNASTDTPRSSDTDLHPRDDPRDGVATMENEAFQGNVSGGYPTVSQNRDTEADTSSPRISDTISDRPVVSSPTREDWGLEAELQTLQNGGLVGESSRTAGTGEVTSQRSGSIRSTTSDNPLYRIPERFRSANASFSSSVPSLLDTPVDSFLGQDETRSATASYSSRMGQGSLPADDGMSLLRKRIIEIREMEGSSTEKARLMHEVMTKQHNSSQASLHAPQMHRPQSPASLMSQDGGPLTPHSSHSGVEYIHNLPTPTSVSPIAEIDNPYRLTADALQPSFVPVPISPPIHTNSANGRRASLSFELNSSMEDERRSLGCQHYKRNVKLQCSACNRWYTCRFCHDEVEDHSLNRRETKNMLCMLCGCPQPVGEYCVDCGERAARYYCGICKLWDNDSEKSIYHCNDCGICRVGQGLGKDYYHCKTCCVCMSISIADCHRCIERSTDCDCPICGEYMFTSPQTVVFMRCGHSIHHLCYYDHMKSSYRCPICSRSIINMEIQFRNLDRSIESQPMPPQFQDTKALVYCNDCSAKTSVKYHWLGLKCAVCDSYNTAQMQILSGPDPEIAAEGVELDSAVAESEPNQGPPSTIPHPNLRGRSSRGAAQTHLGSPNARRPTSSASATDNIRFSPYPIPQRAGRSVSPMRNVEGDPSLAGTHVSDSVATEEIEIEEEGDEGNQDDDDEEEVDFWGGDGHRNQHVRKDGEEECDEDSEGNESDTEIDTDEEADDAENDRMEVFGHR